MEDTPTHPLLASASPFTVVAELCGDFDDVPDLALPQIGLADAEILPDSYGTGVREVNLWFDSFIWEGLPPGRVFSAELHVAGFGLATTVAVNERTTGGSVMLEGRGRLR